MAKNNIKRIAWFMSFMGRQEHGVTKREIDEAWESAGFAENIKPVEDGEYYRKIMPRATFYRLIEAAYDIFGVEIRCEHGRWKIENDSQILVSYTKQMLASFRIMGLINQDGDLRNRILLEDVPSGYQNLEPIIQAIQDRRVTVLIYTPMSDTLELDRLAIKPMGLKLYSRRWYVIGEMMEICREGLRKRIKKKRSNGDYYLNGIETQVENKLFVLALDDIGEVHVTSHKFEMPKMDIAAPFTDFVGTEVDEEADKQKIIIHAYGATGAEIYSLPIHPSQKYVRQLMPDPFSIEVGEEEGIDCIGYYSAHHEEFPQIYEFEYELRPTTAFCREVLKYGSGVRVVTPEEIRKQVQKEVEIMGQRYLHAPESNPVITYDENKNSPLF